MNKLHIVSIILVLLIILIFFIKLEKFDNKGEYNIRTLLNNLYTNKKEVPSISSEIGPRGPEGPQGPKGEPGLDANIPKGIIAIWYGLLSDVPKKWVVCDGKNGTPDLRGRFVLGVDPNKPTKYGKGKTGGAEEVALTVNQMPRHNHSKSYPIHNYPGSGGGGYRYAGYQQGWGNSGYTGGNKPHQNMPPYYALYYIMKL